MFISFDNLCDFVVGTFNHVKNKVFHVGFNYFPQFLCLIMSI